MANRLILTATMIAALFALTLIIPATIAKADHQTHQPIATDQPLATAFPNQPADTDAPDLPDPDSETQIADKTETGTNDAATQLSNLAMMVLITAVGSLLLGLTALALASRQLRT